MTTRDNKLKDLTPLNVSFLPGESPTAEKLAGMMTQVQIGLEYLESVIGDAFGEDEKYNTWLTSLARDLGDRSELNPLIAPNQNILNYTQQLTLGKCEHELDMTPVGDLTEMISNTADSSVVAGQYKTSVAALTKPGDWTIESGYIENGKHKRSRKLITHSPSSGGSIVIAEVTSGRGSSAEDASENLIPNAAQASDAGPFLDIAVADSVTNRYLVTLPVRTKMYDKTGQIVDFSASNTKSGVALNSQYELPSFFFGASGLELETDDPIEGGGKIMPQNLMRLFDWNTKKEVYGIVKVQASPVPEARHYQFILQMKPDVILDTVAGAYVLAVPGNSISKQIKALAQTVYNNNGSGADMTRLVEHSKLLGLRTSSVDHSNRSKYYGPSAIDANDHSQYLHRNGFTDSDTGAGANIMRGSIVVGNTNLGTTDTQHEHYNVLDDSFKLYFGNNSEGGSLFYDKVISHSIDHATNTLPQIWSDNALVITGSNSDADPLKKHIVLDAIVRTTGDVVLGSLASNTIFVQGKLYVNDELTLIGRTGAGLTQQAGKMYYDTNEQSLMVSNGSVFTSPANQSGYTVVIGDGANSFGKYNGTNHVPFNSAIADLTAKGGGTLKVLRGTYNFLTNSISIPANVVVEGAGPLTVIKGTNISIRLIGANCKVRNMDVEGTSVGIAIEADNCFVDDIIVRESGTPINIVSGVGSKIGTNVRFINCGNPTLSTTSAIAEQPIVHSVAFFSSVGTLFDWSRKDKVFREWEGTGGASLTYSAAAASAIGTGAFQVIGNGTIISKKYMPVNPMQGVGGNVCINCTSGATVSVGANFYDSNFNLLGFVPFIASAQVLTTSSIATQFFKNVAANGTAGSNPLNANARYCKPVITITANTGTVNWDLFDLMPLQYARVTSWA